MKIYKQVTTLFLALLCAVSVCLLGACTPKKTDNTVYKIYVPDGAPALAMACVMDDTDRGYKSEITVVAADSINGYLSAGAGADMAIVPTNLAANLYNKGVKYRMVGVTTFGNLFVVGKGAITSVSELEGKKIAVIGQGKVPDHIFKYILKGNGLEGKVDIEYVADGTGAIAAIKTGKADYAVLGEPAATTATTKVEGAQIVFDIQQLYSAASGGKQSPQACLVAKEGVPDEIIAKVVKSLEGNAQWLEEHTDEAVARVGAHMLEGAASSISSLSVEVARRCNIGFKPAGEMRAAVEEYLSAFPAAAIGGKLPDDGFYYVV